jgi:hypothetical protein
LKEVTELIEAMCLKQDTSKFLVLSLGTGQKMASYNATDAAKWGLLRWLSNDGKVPIIDMFSQSSADMVDIHASLVFQACKSEKNYLRIQVLSFLPVKVIQS